MVERELDEERCRHDFALIRDAVRLTVQAGAAGNVTLVGSAVGVAVWAELVFQIAPILAAVVVAVDGGGINRAEIHKGHRHIVDGSLENIGRFRAILVG
jgi:hypothetical protein